MIDPQLTTSRIAAARREKGFTQEELSMRLGVTAQAVSKWERGLSLPDVEMLLELSRKLNVSLEYLLDAEATPPEEMQSIYDVPSGLLEKHPNLPIKLVFGIDLARGMKDFNKDHMPRVAAMRTNILTETGMLLPPIHLKDDLSANAPMQCHIHFFGKAVWENTFTGSASEAIGEVITELERLLRENLALFVNRHMVKLLVENLRASFPFCVEGVVPERVSLTRLKRVCRALVAQGVSIRNFLAIVEAADDALDECGGDARLIEAVKNALER